MGCGDNDPLSRSTARRILNWAQGSWRSRRVKSRRRVTAPSETLSTPRDNSQINNRCNDRPGWDCRPASAKRLVQADIDLRRPDPALADKMAYFAADANTPQVFPGRLSPARRPLGPLDGLLLDAFCLDLTRGYIDGVRQASYKNHF